MNMNYQELAKKAVKNGTAIKKSITKFDFKKKGDQLIGQYLSRESFTFKKGGREGHNYLFSTDTGIVSVIGSHKIDNEIMPMVESGEIVVIEYLGDVDTGGLQPMKDFSLVVIPTEKINQ